MKWIFLGLILSGCNIDSIETKFKCDNDKVYVKFNGAWIESKMYENNKCLSLEESEK
jgi:hypothetical protein